jgi:hypothetical protein
MESSKREKPTESNISSPRQSKPQKEREWTKEEMEKAQPYPMPNPDSEDSGQC